MFYIQWNTHQGMTLVIIIGERHLRKLNHITHTKKLRKEIEKKVEKKMLHMTDKGYVNKIISYIDKIKYKNYWLL